MNIAALCADAEAAYMLLEHVRSELYGKLKGTISYETLLNISLMLYALKDRLKEAYDEESSKEATDEE